MTMIRPETEMKDSGVEWIKYVPENWNCMPLKRYFQFGKGLPITKADLTENGEKVISYGQIHAKFNTGVSVDDRLIRFVSSEYKSTNPNSLCSKGDIILADTSEDKEGCGNAVYIDCDEKIFAGYHTIILKSTKDNKYLAYLFQSDSWRTQIQTRVNGVKLFSITQKILNQCTIILPTLSEQQAIADYLDKTCSKIDEIIAEAKASIDEYKNLREAVISNATTRGIKTNRSLKSSGVEWLPEIPADWNVLSPKVVFTQRKDRAIKGERQLTASQKHGIMYQDDYMKEEGVRIVTVEKDFNILKHVEPDDFVISMRSFQGGLEYSYLRGCISSAYVMLIPNHKYVYSEYYKWFFKSDKYINALQSTSDLIRDGQALRYANFVKLKLFDIPIEEQKEIADYLNKKVPKIDSLITEKESLINDLEAYKKSLIYEVVTGKRKVV